MIIGLSDFKSSLDQLARAVENMEYTISKYKDSDHLIAYAGSGEVDLRDLLTDVYDFVAKMIELSDLDFHMEKATGIGKGGDVGIVSEFFKDVQSVLWAAGEKVLGLEHRGRGLPAKEVLDNCSLKLAFARRGSLHLGFTFISPDILFYDTATRDNAVEYITSVFGNLNSSNSQFFVPKNVQLAFLRRIREFSRLVGKKFNAASVFYRSVNHSNFAIQEDTYKVAEDMLHRYIKPKKETINGVLGILNFFSDSIVVKTSVGRISMYYDPDVIAEDAVAAAANRDVRVTGTAFYSSQGQLVDFIPQTLEIVQ